MAEPLKVPPGMVVAPLPGQQTDPLSTGSLQRAPSLEDQMETEESEMRAIEDRGEHFGMYSIQKHQQMLNRYRQLQTMPPSIERNDEAHRLFDEMERGAARFRQQELQAGKPDPFRESAPSRAGGPEETPRGAGRLGLDPRAPINITRGLVEGAAGLVEAIGQAGRYIPNLPGFRPHTGEEGRNLARRIRQLAPEAPPAAQTPTQTVLDYTQQGLGALPPGIAQWMGNVPLAVLSGDVQAENTARARGRQPTAWQRFESAAIEGVVRKFLGGVVQSRMGPVTTGLVFGGTSAATGLYHGKTPDQIGMDAVAQFLLGTIGNRISPSERRQIRLAEEAVARGEGQGALRHLDPIIRRHADVIARAAYETDARIEPIGPPRGGTDVGPVRPRPPPRPRQLESGENYFTNAAGEMWRVHDNGQTSRMSGGATTSGDRPQRTVYVPANVALHFQNAVAEWTYGPVRIEGTSATRGATPGIRVYGFNPASGGWRPLPKANVLIKLEPQAGYFPLHIYQGGARFQLGSQIREVQRRTPQQPTQGAQPAASQEQQAPGGPPPIPPTGTNVVPFQPAPSGGGRPPLPPAIDVTGGGFTMPPPPGRGGPPGPPRLPPVAAGQSRLARERAEAIVATNITIRERADALVRDFTDRMELAFRGVPALTRFDWIRNWMQGRREAIPEPYRAFFVEAEKILAQQAIAEHLTGDIHYEMRRNYFHLFWKPRDQGRAAAYGRDSAANFRKPKVFDDIQEGIDAGFEPATTNPGVYVAARLEAGNRAMQRVLTMRRLEEGGLAIEERRFNRLFPLRKGRAGALGARQLGRYAGWERIQIGTHNYLIHPRAKKIVEWGLGIDQRSLASMMNLSEHGMAARTGRAFGTLWTRTRNTVIPMKLSLSAFHAMHMLQIRISQPLGVILEHALNRRMSGRDMYRSLRDIDKTAAEAYGRRQAEVFKNPDEVIGPDGATRHLVSEIEKIERNLMIAGGFNPHMPSIYQLNAERLLRRIMNDEIPRLLENAPTGYVEQLARASGVTVEMLKATLLKAGQGIEAMQHDMFAVWIPSMKTAAYLTQAKQLIARRPELLGGDLQSTARLRHELRQIQKSIDNRFGMMQYDKVFGPRLMKQFFMSITLSVGWNYGFFREFLLGPARSAEAYGRNIASAPGRDLRRQQGESTVDEPMSTSLAYASTYIAAALITGFVLNYLLSGKLPESGKDLIYPQMPDGSRINTQMFTREFGAFYYHARNEGVGAGTLELLASKANSLISAVIDAIRGHDYFGRQIYDPNASWYTQTLQIAKHVFVASSLPISVSSMDRTGGDPARIALGFAGYNPAPRYVEMSGIVAMIHHAYNQQHPHSITPWSQLERTADMRRARQFFNEFKRTGNRAYLRQFTQAITEYARRHPEQAGAGGENITRTVEGWTAPEGAIQFRFLDPATQIAIFRRMSPAEKIRYLPYLRRTPSNLQNAVPLLKQ